MYNHSQWFNTFSLKFPSNKLCTHQFNKIASLTMSPMTFSLLASMINNPYFVFPPESLMTLFNFFCSFVFLSWAPKYCSIPRLGPSLVLLYSIYIHSFFILSSITVVYLKTPKFVFSLQTISYSQLCTQLLHWGV